MKRRVSVQTELARNYRTVDIRGSAEGDRAADGSVVAIKPAVEFAVALQRGPAERGDIDLDGVVRVGGLLDGGCAAANIEHAGASARSYPDVDRAGGVINVDARIPVTG